MSTLLKDLSTVSVGKRLNKSEIIQGSKGLFECSKFDHFFSFNVRKEIPHILSFAYKNKLMKFARGSRHWGKATFICTGYFATFHNLKINPTFMWN